MFKFNLIMLFSFLSFFPFYVLAQNDKSQNHKIYKVKIYEKNLKTKGVLYNVTDSAFILVNNLNSHKQIFDTIICNKIKEIYVVRRSSAGTGFLIGAATSITYGILKSTGEYDDLEKFSDIFAGIFIAPFTGIVGAIIGNNSGKKFVVNYDYNQFINVKNQLQEKVLR
jgi:hypothetical protein